MDDMFEQINYHLLMSILKLQFEILDRLDRVAILVARPPIKIYRPVKEVDHR